jgi:hypothetical protein
VAHWKSLMERDYMFAFDLQGKEWTLTIREVKGGTVVGEGGKKSKKPICWFEKAEKPLALNSTNCKAIAGMYGNDVSAWVGKQVTLYPTTTTFGKETVDCIRIKPVKPKEQTK